MNIDINPEIFAANMPPFMLLDAKANMVYANPAARPLSEMLTEHRLLWLRELLKATSNNEKPLHQLATESLPPEARNWDIWLTSAETSEYALWFTPQESAAPEKTSDIPGLSLIGQQMRDEMTAYASMLGDYFFSIKDSAAVPAHFQLMAKTRQLSEQLNELARLSELHERNPLGKEERIYLYSLINQLISQAGSFTARPVKWIVDPSGALLAPIYGDKSWMELALRAYLKKLATSAPDGGAIHLQFQQIGGYASLIGRCHPDITQPVGENRDSPSAQAETHTYDLSLLLAERVLQLHGAEIKILRLPDQTRFESIRITFPAAFPQTARPDVWCQNCPAVDQSAAFARDIATLTRVRKNA